MKKKNKVVMNRQGQVEVFDGGRLARFLRNIAGIKPKTANAIERIDFEEIVKRVEVHLSADEDSFPLGDGDGDGGVAAGYYKTPVDPVSALYRICEERCKFLYRMDPIYLDMADTLAVYSLHKETSGDFGKVLSALNANKRAKKGLAIDPESGDYRVRRVTAPGESECAVDETKYNESGSLFNPLYYEFALANLDRIRKEIHYENDYLYDYFGISTLRRSYLWGVDGRPVERPQDALMRVSLAIHMDSIDDAIDYYNVLSHKLATPASPQYFNAGSRNQQLFSCYLKTTNDSINSMYNSLACIANIMKGAGGMSLAVSAVRSQGAYIAKSNGTSTGVIPYIKSIEKTTMHVDQGGGKRRGALAVCNEPHNIDYPAFLKLKSRFSPEHLEAKYLFYISCNSDLFMRRAYTEYQRWKTTKTFLPNDTWTMFSADDVDHGLSLSHGREYTRRYLAAERYARGLVTEGAASVPPPIRCEKAGALKLLIENMAMAFESGGPSHIFKDAINAKSSHQHYCTITTTNLCQEVLQPTCDSIEGNGRAYVPRYVTDQFFFCKPDNESGGGGDTSLRQSCPLSSVQLDGGADDDSWDPCCYEEKRRDGDVNGKGINRVMWFNTWDCEESIQTDKNELKFILDSCFPSKAITSMTQAAMDAIDWPTDTTDWLQKDLNERRNDTGYYKQPSDSMETGVCVLASIILQNFYIPADDVDRLMAVMERRGYTKADQILPRDRIDYGLLKSVAGKVAVSLDKMIDINKYPTRCSMRGAFLHRSIGIGVQGLADLMAFLMVPWESEEAMFINEWVAETIYFGATEASMKRARAYGPYPTFRGSPASKGILQFDMWKRCPSSGLWDWAQLKDDIVQFGLRNADRTAYPPTASTAQIGGSNESFEPFNELAYVRNTIDKYHIVVNRHLADYMWDRGYWNPATIENILQNQGSVRCVPDHVMPPHDKAVFKTVYEIDQLKLVDLSAVRGAYVDGSQSQNYYLSEISIDKLLEIVFRSWVLGLKTGLYYAKIKKLLPPMKFTEHCNSASTAAAGLATSPEGEEGSKTTDQGEKVPVKVPAFVEEIENQVRLRFIKEARKREKALMRDEVYTDYLHIDYIHQNIDINTAAAAAMRNPRHELTVAEDTSGGGGYGVVGQQNGGDELVPMASATTVEIGDNESCAVGCTSCSA